MNSALVPVVTKADCAVLKLPVLLVVVHVIVPVGFEPVTVAVQVTGEPAVAGLGVQVTDV